MDILDKKSFDKRTVLHMNTCIAGFHGKVTTYMLRATGVKVYK